MHVYDSYVAECQLSIPCCRVFRECFCHQDVMAKAVNVRGRSRCLAVSRQLAFDPSQYLSPLHRSVHHPARGSSLGIGVEERTQLEETFDRNTNYPTSVRPSHLLVGSNANSPVCIPIICKWSLETSYKLHSRMLTGFRWFPNQGMSTILMRSVS